MKIKTSDLIHDPLDWAVATCNDTLFDSTPYSYSTDWAHGGPILEREKITLDVYLDGGHIRGHEWSAQVWGNGADPIAEEMGETPLIAAMRAFVASKLGDEVDVPDGLSVLHTAEKW